MSVQEALLCIPYGVYVITTGAEAKNPGAFTASWLMQVSFDPLLVALAADKTSHSQALLAEHGVFAVNFLSQRHTTLAARLGTPHRINPHKFNGVAWQPGVTGAPLLDEAMAHLECQVTRSLDPDGDHVILIGSVVAGAVRQREAALTLERSGLRYR